MTNGDCGDLALRVERNRQMVSVTLKRDAPVTWDYPTHDLAGPTFRLLSKDVAYLKLSSVQQSEAAHYVEQAAATKGLSIDIRNYPSQFTVFALGGLLVDRSRTFARFTEGDLSNPGAFRCGDVENLQALTPHYAGKVVVLVDEVSQSQAEYTAMAFRASRNTVIVGSTTAGRRRKCLEVLLARWLEHDDQWDWRVLPRQSSHPASRYHLEHYGYADCCRHSLGQR